MRLYTYIVLGIMTTTILATPVLAKHKTIIQPKCSKGEYLQFIIGNPIGKCVHFIYNTTYIIPKKPMMPCILNSSSMDNKNRKCNLFTPTCKKIAKKARDDCNQACASEQLGNDPITGDNHRFNCWVKCISKNQSYQGCVIEDCGSKVY